ncbi:17749_t:CDS:2 [Dentiscutata erythropus]|uniref:(d)CMP kinase n=1 Tax=Dentiscutata erythropus TaxID=1348616 RepID=A0A9N8ZWZ2_9GLOM|nr:17749_t:CDS:2 [Dentiscutata erythropus]
MDPRFEFHFSQLFQAFIRFFVSINQIYFQTNLIQQQTSPNLIDIESLKDLIYTPKFKGFKYINDYLSKNRYINKHEFFLKSNEIRQINMTHKYTYGSTIKKINIAIDELTAVGKTTVGSALANNTENNLKTIEIFKKNVTENDKLFESITEIINSLGNKDYYLSGEEGAKISKNQEAHEIINQYIRQITKEKEFVVVGKNATFNILPDTEIKIVLSANIDIRVQHCSLQINLTDIKNIFTDILYRDYFSFKQLEQAKKVSTIINTTNNNYSEVTNKIFSIIRKKSLTTNAKFILKYSLIFLVFFLSYLLNKQQ